MAGGLVEVEVRRRHGWCVFIVRRCWRADGGAAARVEFFYDIDILEDAPICVVCI